MTAILDDHLLRDWMVGPDAALRRSVGDEPLATTNLWYARLCKSAARAGSGALVGNLNLAERQALVAALVRLSDQFAVTPMRDLAWRMGVLIAEQNGLSTLGVEAVAAAEALGARVLVSSRDDSPGSGMLAGASVSGTRPLTVESRDRRPQRLSRLPPCAFRARTNRKTPSSAVTAWTEKSCSSPISTHRSWQRNCPKQRSGR